MRFSNFHVPANCLGILLESRFGFSISKETPSDVVAAGPWTTLLGLKDQQSMDVSLLHGGW